MTTSPLSTVGRALRKRHWLIWGIALIACGLAYAATMVRPPIYEASALLSLDETQNVNQGFDIAIQADQYLTQRYLTIATSQVVLKQVCAQESPPCDPGALSRQVVATALKATGLIAITARASSPVVAARLANEVAQDLLTQSSIQVADYLGPQRNYLQKQLDQINGQITALQKSIEAAQYSSWSPAMVSNTLAPLISQLNTLQTQYASTYTRMQDVEVLQTKLTSVLAIQQPATPPARPSDPDLVRYLLVGGAGGLVTGFLLALLAERYRGRLQDGADLAEASGSPLVLAVDGREPAGGAGPYALLAQVDLHDHPDGAQIVLVAAAVGEPIDEVAMSLAEAVAGYDRRVLVIPSGPPALEAEAGQPPALGSRIVVRPGGLSGGQTPGLDHFDLTIRCAPVPLWLKPGSGAVVLVATQGRTRFGEARSTSQLLRRVGIEPSAAILLARGAVGRWRARRTGSGSAPSTEHRSLGVGS